MLRKLKLTNFKCFKSMELACSPLTLLCGLNGMGKSSIIQALLVLRQSSTTGELREGRLVLGGELADLGTGQDVLCEDAEADVVEFELHRADNPTPCRFSFDYSRTADELRTRGASQGVISPTDPGSNVLNQWTEVPPLGGRLVYVNAERIGPRKFYHHSEVFARRGNLGTRGEYTPNYLSARQGESLSSNDPRCSDPRRRRLMEVIDHWLQEVTPGVHLQLETIQDADAIIAGFSFDHPGDVETRRYRATNVGFGLSYTLPVLTALLEPPGSLCLIENPEAYLHPRGQTRLAELAVRASLAGVQVIVETHSDHFMDGVRIAVREGLVRPEDVAFHYFSREGAEAVVSSPRVDADGRLSTWPEGFFDQHEDNLIKLLGPRS